MKRCGFDEFAIRDDRVLNALVEGRIHDVPVHYQPAGRDDVEIQPPGARPWLRLEPGARVAQVRPGYGEPQGSVSFHPWLADAAPE